jgi:hypothetical protein
MTKDNAKADLKTELEVYKKEGANLLMPSTQIEGLSEFHAPVIEKVTLSSNPIDGDVYPHSDEEDPGKQKFRLTKQALMKLSVCAGIIWSVSETRRVDDGSNRNYVCYQAVGGLKKADGTPIFFKAQYDMDFEVVEAELRALYEKKTTGAWAKSKSPKEKAEYVEYCVTRDMLQKRKHKLKLAEAGAMNRVVREILGLKNTYTIAELAKPFVMARIVFRPDYSDKDVKAKMIDAHIKAMTGIYGGAAIADVNKETAAIDITPVHENDDPPPPDTSSSEEKLKNQLVDFENSDELGQCKSLTLTAIQKGYDLAGYMKKANRTQLSEFSKEKREDFFKHLLSLPDKGDTKPKDDVPY